MPRRLPAPADHLVIRVGKEFCACGCLELIAKGRKFRPGHDARLKAALVRAELLGQNVYTENYLWIDEAGLQAHDDDGNPIPVFAYNNQYRNCTWTPFEYGCHTLSERGQAALWEAMGR